uniref:Ubiquitin-like protease family profile domain-containing protein n=1 Tax=Glossina austeni TaxID=7395 RepID=A0A1A9V6V2_GLOAU
MRVNFNNTRREQHPITIESKTDSILFPTTVKYLKEKVTISHTKYQRDIENFKRSDLSDCNDPLTAVLSCEVVRLGPHVFKPKEPVIITSKGIRIVAPLQKNPNETCILNIYKHEVVKAIAHFSLVKNSMLCFYTLRSCAQYIKNALKLPDDPALLEGMTNFSAILHQADEISSSDAQGFLQRTTQSDPKFVGHKETSETNLSITQLQPNDNRQLLIYPPGRGGISIHTIDYLCLATDQYINDIIIDFYLKWFYDRIPKVERDRTFIFSALFYQTLTAFARDINPHKRVNETDHEKSHVRVRNWTKNVNLFEKDFIIIPINENSHWFLAIVCFPSLKGPVAYDTHLPIELPRLPKRHRENCDCGEANVCIAGDDRLCLCDSDPGSKDISPVNNSSQPIKQPLILIFDSFAVISHKRVMATLRDYLSCEYKVKLPGIPSRTFNKYNMPGHHVRVPQQNNSTDCGLYLLQYVEEFFKNPIRDYRIPINDLANWFDTITVRRKREDIANLLQELMNEHNGCNNKILLPNIPFPTLNGQLIEPKRCDSQFEMEEVIKESSMIATSDPDPDDETRSSGDDTCKKSSLFHTYSSVSNTRLFVLFPKILGLLLFNNQRSNESQNCLPSDSTLFTMESKRLC